MLRKPRSVERPYMGRNQEKKAPKGQGPHPIPSQNNGQNRAVLPRHFWHDRSMARKNNHKLSPRATLSSVAAAMAKPRVAESAKRGGDTFANGGHSVTAPSAKETPVPHADVSVDHPLVVEKSRSAHPIAMRLGRGEAISEDLRMAMIHYRSLFEDLVLGQIPGEKKERPYG